MFLAVISSLATYELSKVRRVGAVRASSIIGIVVFFLGTYFPLIDSTYLFGATFVGMCSSSKLNRLELILASLVYSFSLSFLSKHFIGFGGLLGMSSFIGVVSVFLLSLTHKKIRRKIKY